VKTAREIAHQLFGGECCSHEVLGWSHGHRCEAVRDAIAPVLEERAKEAAEWRRLVEEAQGETKSAREAHQAILQSDQRLAVQLLDACTERDRLNGELAEAKNRHDLALGEIQYQRGLVEKAYDQRQKVEAELAEARRLLDGARRWLARYGIADLEMAMDFERIDAQVAAGLPSAPPAEQAQPSVAHAKQVASQDAHAAEQAQPTCQACGGDGYSRRPNFGDWPCDTCRGRGKAAVEDAQPTIATEDCDTCIGPGNLCDEHEAEADREEAAEQAQGEGALTLEMLDEVLRDHINDEYDRSTALAKRVKGLEDYLERIGPLAPASPPPEAAGPGHAWRCAAGGSSCVVDGCRCADCDVPKNIHAVPPIPEGTQ
jgi:ribosomal protein L37AE/L43A